MLSLSIVCKHPREESYGLKSISPSCVLTEEQKNLQLLCVECSTTYNQQSQLAHQLLVLTSPIVRKTREIEFVNCFNRKYGGVFGWLNTEIINNYILAIKNAISERLWNLRMNAP